MAEFRTVNDKIAVAGQITADDLTEAARNGYLLVINNRPDGEAPDQPASRDLEAAATDLGLAYAHVPVRGAPSPEQVETVRKLVESTPGPVLAFCRSGTRSINTWALGQAQAGNLSRDELVRLGREAGYDLSGVLGA